MTTSLRSDIATIYVGFDPRESDGFAVTRASIRNRTITPYPVRGLVLAQLREAGLYTRPTEVRDGRLWDVISEAPMATEFACSRFLVPYLESQRPRSAGLAVFMDSDMLVRRGMEHLAHWITSQPDWERRAVWVVKHNHVPTSEVKMDNQVQTVYSRKNWSSVMVFNCNHPANSRLDLELVNSVPGRDLHGFCWLEDDEIGELPRDWNYLIGVSEPLSDPAIVHFTEGLPSMAGYMDQLFADDWRETLGRWAAQ